MSQNNENKLVPRLRFPEFKNTQAWLLRTLNDVADMYQPKTISQSEFKDKGHLVYGANGVIGYYDRYNHETSQIAIACRGSSCGTVNFTEPKSWITGNAMVVNVDGFKDIDKKFMFYQLLVANFNYLITGSGQPQITGNIKNHKVVLTNLEEQQKIAACLSSLDDVITAESKKLEVLKEQKKGLLQNLFPQEGETVPKLRFKEFEDSGEWVSDILKNVFTIFQGFAFSSNDSVNDGVRWLKIADVGIQQMNHLSPSYLPYEFKDKYENFLVKEGDYVIALTRPILNKKLKISKVDNTLHNSLLNQRVGKLVSNKCIDFVYYLVQTSNLISRIEQNIAGSEPPNLSAQQIENIEVFIPPTKKEQQKIANTLSSIDDLINAQSQKIETLKLHKKGLLQGLFPDVNEHNG